MSDVARGRGAARVRAVAARATHLADNPFESVARDVCDGVAGLHVVRELLAEAVALPEMLLELGRRAA